MEAPILTICLRLTERAELTVTQAYGSLEAFEGHLNQNICWMFQQKHRRYVHGKWVVYPPATVLLCGDSKLVLSKPIMSCERKKLAYYYNVVTVVTSNREDRSDAISGREVSEPIEVRSSEYRRETRVALKENGGTTPSAHPKRPSLQPETMSDSSAIVKEEIPVFDHSLSFYCCPSTNTIFSSRGIAKYCAVCGSRIDESHRMSEERPPSSIAFKPGIAPLNDKQHFMVSPVCPKCEKTLVPWRGVFCTQCRHELPSKLAVHRELVVAVKKKEYRELATHLRQSINAAWNHLLRGRKVQQSTSVMGQAIFLVTVTDEFRTSTVADEQRLDEILNETQTGRVSADIYELKRAREMLGGATGEEVAS